MVCNRVQSGDGIRPPCAGLLAGVHPTATDRSGVSCSLDVVSNEPADGTGDGNTAEDWIVIDEHHVQLRAERSGRGSGRAYTITATCGDRWRNTRAVDAVVRVPADAR